MDGLIVGRDAVLDKAWRLLAVPPAVALVDGPAGIGKTALWRTLVSRAGRAGWLVLTCAPAESETGLPFAALADLLRPLTGLLAELPPPQRMAAEVALLAADTAGPVDERAIGAATRALLDTAVARAGSTPVLVAVDDAPWLDPPSERALRFALRRVTPAITILVTCRTSDPAPGPVPLGLDQGPARDRLVRFGLPPLGVGALHHILRDRLDTTLSRPLLARIAGGGGSVRSVTDDGLTWRLDPSADGADELAVGKVMFVTGRGVGRVVDVRREGDDLAVTIGPVQITEVIRDGTFGSDKPISFENVVTYQVGTPFWSAGDGGTSDSGDGGTGGGTGGGVAGGYVPVAVPARPVLPDPGDRAAQPGPRVGGGASPVDLNGFNVTPICCDHGAGVRFGYDREGIRLLGEAAFTWNRPSGTFNLDISGGTVRTATFRITGGAGIRLKIEGASAVGAGHNIDPVLKLPVDFTVPLGVFLGVPFSATVNQTLNIRTAFSAKNGNIKAEGEWKVDGGLGFGYANGSFGVQQPTLNTTSNIVDSIEGISVGVNGIVFVYQARFHVGIGAFGFNTGLYAALTTSVGLTVGSAAGFPITFCRSAQVGVWLDYGVGYSMPQVVADVINFFLRVFDAKPINRQGGIGATENIFNSYTVDPPDKPICRK
ncbi:AAA family ATPase [Micromonospora sp. NPDC050397]|uniref:AAA family ATPase n=1 Tax=Micromonospora sp. NPDC050397 TaxID=3364279 RepID=UPI00384DF90C